MKPKLFVAPCCPGEGQYDGFFCVTMDLHVLFRCIAEGARRLPRRADIFPLIFSLQNGSFHTEFLKT